MDLRAAVAVAKRQITETFAADAPSDVRLESFVYDDHMMIWSLTLGFVSARDGSAPRVSKIVRVSETNQSVLSIRDP